MPGGGKKGGRGKMLKKTHALALTVATAGLLGFAAPMASAATMALGGNPPSAVNVTTHPVPVEGNARVASLLSPGSVTKAKAVNNRGCEMKNNETNKHGDGGGLVNATGN